MTRVQWLVQRGQGRTGPRCTRAGLPLLGKVTQQCEVLDHTCGGQYRWNTTYLASSPCGKQSYFRKVFIPTLAAPNFPYLYVLFEDSRNLAYHTVSGEWFPTFRWIVVPAYSWIITVCLPNDTAAYSGKHESLEIQV
jgi:hypothetical protein